MGRRISPSSMNEDIISNLPESLIHHILSFLHMKYAVQTSVLSKRWRDLWTSLPILNLHDGLFLSPETEEPNSFIDFVDRVLILRGSSDIQRLHLIWEDESATPSRLNTWIFSAVKRNVQELYVNATVYEKFSFPHCLFTCKSLTKLELEMGTRSESEIILPNSMCLPRLKSMKLVSLSFGDEELTNKLFSSCPLLESLIIIACHMKFNISSFNLKHFKLDNYVHDSQHDSMFKTVKLHAPNLTSFSCKDYMTQNYSLENLSSLVTADINMIVEQDERNEMPETFQMLSAAVKELYAQRMMKFFRAVRNVKDLKLSSGFLEGVSEALDLLDSQPPQFSNLRHLTLQTWVSRNCMNAITYLLKISPNIESISLRITKLNLADIEGDWEARLSFPSMLYDHLKFVEIQGFIGCVNELKFLEILLKNAMVLEELVLFSFEAESPDKDGQLMEFKEKLLAFPMASSSITILYKSY